jgi:colanic acid/amylovoran biosynthesis glycosyltransferase
MKSDSINIGHYHPVWLPSTMTWLYNQINGLNFHAKNHIICELTENLDQFQIDNLYVFGHQNHSIRLKQKLARYLGFSTSLGHHITSLEQNQCQVLHSHFGHIAVEGSKIARHLGIPHVASFYGMDVHQLPNLNPDLRLKYLQMFERTDLVLCEGPFMATSIEELGCPSDKIKIHPLGVNLGKLPFHYRSTDDKLSILIAASFRQKKGIPLALEAIANIRDKYDIKITIVGDSGRDPASIREKNMILNTIKDHSLSDIIEFKGMLKFDTLTQIAKEHHIFLSPSIHASDGDCEGGAPVSIIEMGAMGLINVSSKHCDIPGVVIDNDTGYLAEENDLESLVYALERAIESRNRWNTISENSRKHIENRFDSTHQSLKLFNHYVDLIDV